MISTIAIILCLSAYLLGSISGAILSCRLWHLPDPRTHGSKNPGATNIYRLGGVQPALFTLLCDALKGVIPVWLAALLSAPPLEQGMVGMFAILGHMLPVFHGFRGGKGVATTLGVGLVIAPATSLILIIVWGSILKMSHTSSIASLTSAFIAPVLALVFNPDFTLVFLILSALIGVRHRDNLIRIVRRQEAKTRKQS
ncbi:MAG: glycerol-3-phosphate 1-O-acyltransferase PlsY [Pseudomonadales bacterium]|nr:glycerol-3-phosphate 1-O-acyltransferase PlsY [Pseudomonadales bacterium]